MKLPRDVGTITERSPGISKITTRARRILTRSHGSTRIRNCGNKDNKYQGNKESKPKDTCITVTKDVKYFCSTGYDKGIFSAVTKLLR